jgi:hypothetical protein
MTETRAGRAGLTQLTRSPKIPVHFTIGTCRTTVIAPVRTLNELTPQFERVPTLKDRGFRLPKP